VTGSEEWDLEVRPHLTPYFAYAAAFLIAVAHIAVGFLLKIGSTGVIFQTADQVAIGLLGVIIAGLVLLFARPRVRVGVTGIAIRNLLTYKLIPWSAVVDVSFPQGARWARVDLPGARTDAPLPPRRQPTLNDIVSSSAAPRVVPLIRATPKPRRSYTPRAAAFSVPTRSVTVRTR
jgi:hypothetical protein